MAASSRLMITEAERRFPVRIRIAADQGWGRGSIRCRRGSTRMLAPMAGQTPSGARGVVSDAIAIYLADATIASAFVARWCAGHRAEAADGLFRVREDGPAPRIGASHHKTPP